MAVIVYFVIHGWASDPAEGVRIALPVALVVTSGYMLAAHRRHLLKQFDFGLWSMFAVLFAAGGMLAAWAPHDILFSIVYPNLLVFVAGVPSQIWLPPLYLRVFGPHPPESAEAAILGMPLTFDAKAGADANATIQIHVSGADGGDFWLRVADGTCESSEGRAPSAQLTIHTPSSVWLAMARGELDGPQALLDQRYSIEGDSAILLRFGEWCSSGR